MCMLSYAGSAPSRAAGRVTSANHLSFSLERTCCIVLDFCPHLYFFGFTFLSVPARSPWLPKSRRVWSKVHTCEKTDWDGVLKKSLPQEFLETGGIICELKNGTVDSLCWGVRARFYMLSTQGHHCTEIDATRQNQNASVIRSARLRCFTSEASRTLLFAFLCKYERNANTWKLAVVSRAIKRLKPSMRLTRVRSLAINRGCSL